MAGYNHCTLLGNLTRSPEVRYAPSGTAIAKLGLAVNRRFKQGDELKEEVLFVDVVAFGRTAENVAKYCDTGAQVLVDGRLCLRRWETEDGQKRSKHEVVAQSVTFMPKKEHGGDNGQGTPDADGSEYDFEEPA
jgi:single-strand DNA-binding protein